MKKDKIKFINIIIIIFIFLSFTACGGEEKGNNNEINQSSPNEEKENKDNEESKALKIVRGQNYPPYHYVNENGELVGICVEVVENVFDKLGVDIEFEQNSWTRCLHLVEIGKADAMMNLFKTDERSEFMHFDNNVIEYEINALWTKKENAVNYTGDILKSIGDKSIGIIKDYSYGEAFDSIKEELNIDDTSINEEVLVKKLASDRLDFIFGNQLVIKWQADKMGVLDEIKMLEPVVSKGGLHIGFSKANDLEEVSKKFSDTLESFKESKEYDNIINKYNK